MSPRPVAVGVRPSEVQMVVLLTDFGQSEYVGVMKGIVYSICPTATVV
ncbi:MAG TPA: hypothetical protein ENN81_02745, partial [Phycisphaerales bacterium]|nr:hypothetical protein [Phycisphaerales bacterium]